MKQYKYEVFINNVVAFAVKGDCEAIKATRDFINSQIKASFTVAAKANNKTIIYGEQYPTWGRGIEETIKNRVIDMLWESTQLNSPMYKANVGDKSNSAITVCGIRLSWECISGRAPARPKHVIAAEKAARAAKSQARQEQKAKWEKEQQERIVNVRKRIKYQVDHAFATGKSGTEPASKYITCQHCDAPAAFLELSQKLPPGTAVLDEDTIVGAICGTHNWRNSGTEKIPCSKLEFFYDGVRQIAIKR